jgi:hypothetical protein
MKSLSAIADEINAAAENYQMGQFQELRRQIHGSARATGHRIFTEKTTREDWAFHLGGRTELQFNIGFEHDEGDWFRYGIAFSLEPSQTVPQPLILEPKIRKLDQFLTRNTAQFEDLRFWYYTDDRSPTLPIQPIPNDAITTGAFLFWGHLCPRAEADANTVLFLFDRLLPIYLYVEGGQPATAPQTSLRKGLIFKPGCADKLQSTTAQSAATTLQVNLRHNAIQSALHKALSAQFGPENVGTENDTGRGSRIDLVVRDGPRHTFYEIKPYPCLRSCLREALGQLLEYSYWPGGNPAHQMVVVSENPITPDAARYLQSLRKQFSLPIYHQRIDVATAHLYDPE